MLLRSNCGLMNPNTAIRSLGSFSRGVPVNAHELFRGIILHARFSAEILFFRRCASSTTTRSNRTCAARSWQSILICSKEAMSTCIGSRYVYFRSVAVPITRRTGNSGAHFSNSRCQLRHKDAGAMIRTRWYEALRDRMAVTVWTVLPRPISSARSADEFSNKKRTPSS